VIGEKIRGALRRLGTQTVILPLGLGHRDHELTAAGAAWAARRSSELAWFAYKDLPYAYEEPNIEAALEKLSDMAPAPVGLDAEPRSSDKAAALDCYPTQMRGLGAERREKAMLAEGYWSLSPRSTGRS
jgi:LmbE family N-acetylglucosaminyl deacetylase